MMEKRFRNSAPDIPLNELFTSSIDMCKKGFERTAQLQKQTLDAIAQQNAEGADVWRSMLTNIPGAEQWVNFVEKSIATVIDVQTQFVDFVGEQNTESAEYAKTKSDEVAQFTRETTGWADHPEDGQKSA